MFARGWGRGRGEWVLLFDGYRTIEGIQEVNRTT